MTQNGVDEALASIGMLGFQFLLILIMLTSAKSS